MPKLISSTYRFTIYHGILARNLRKITQMSPYVELNMGGVIRKTKIARDSGTLPKWNQQITITSYGGTLLRVQVHDQGIYNSEIIGEGIEDLKIYGLTCDLEENIEYNKPHEIIIQLLNEGKPAGQLFISVKRISQQFSAEKYLNSVNLQQNLNNRDPQPYKRRIDSKILKDVGLKSLLKKTENQPQKQNDNFNIKKRIKQLKGETQNPRRISADLSQRNINTDRSRYSVEDSQVKDYLGQKFSIKENKQRYPNLPLYQQGLPSKYFESIIYKKLRG